MLFDKTGTLTQEQPEVSGIFVADNEYRENDILALASAGERKFAHPIAKSIVQKAEEIDLDIPIIDDGRHDTTNGTTCQRPFPQRTGMVDDSFRFG